MQTGMDRKTGKQIYILTHSQADRRSDRQADRYPYIQTGVDRQRKTDIEAEAERQTGRQRQTGRDRHADTDRRRLTVRQADIHIDKQSDR